MAGPKRIATIEAKQHSDGQDCAKLPQPRNAVGNDQKAAGIQKTKSGLALPCDRPDLGGRKGLGRRGVCGEISLMHRKFTQQFRVRKPADPRIVANGAKQAPSFIRCDIAVSDRENSAGGRHRTHHFAAANQIVADRPIG